MITQYFASLALACLLAWLSTGTVIAGMDVANAIFNPTPSSSGGISQSDYTQKGNSWLKKNYPDTNFIVSAAIRQ